MIQSNDNSTMDILIYKSFEIHFSEVGFKLEGVLKSVQVKRYLKEGVFNLEINLEIL